MKGKLRRGLADLACRLLQPILPRSLRSWGWAIRCETASIPDATQALLFALGSLCALAPRVVAAHLFHPSASPVGNGGLHIGGSIAMNIYNSAMKHPRVLGIACAVGAVALGLVYLTIAGAPARYLAVNAGALAVGLATLFLLDRISAGWHQWAGASIAVMAAALLATALLGREADGAARWVNLAGFAIQPSLVLLPVMLLAFSRTRDATATAGIVVAAAAMALQPDRAMAGMLVLGTGVLAAMRLDRHILAALAASVAGFVATLARADILPATPYVDQILYTSFDVHAAAGAAVLGGSALLLVPAIIGWSRDPAHRATYATFGLVWLAAVMAAALGNYPTPVVGYGGSAVLGYVLSLLALPTVAGDRAGAAIPPARSAGGAPDNHHPIVGIA